MIPARARDHGGVVGIEARARDGDARFPAEPLSREIAQRFTTRDSPPQHGGLVSGEIDRALELRDEHLEHRVLKAARDMRPVALDIVRGAHGVEDGGLEAGKRELESSAIIGRGNVKRAGPAPAAFSRVLGPPGVGEAVFEAGKQEPKSSAIIGRGNVKRDGSPSRAILSICGPPGYPRPSRVATLSNASPAASSRVSPRSR